jgi:sugar O-acyltransferase (sialic acid O-acetyltransferase NeuD family)
MSERLPILLVGAGGHARACIDVIEQSGIFSVFGLTGLAEQVGSSILGYRVLGTDADLASLRSQVGHALVVVGQIKTPQARIALFDMLEKQKFVMPAVVSARAYVSPHAVVGAGSIVMHGAVVNAGARVGRNCILNSQSLVEHDAVVEDHCHISTGALINGGAQIGTGTFVGSGSMVREAIRIGERCVIGMGQRILSDCPDHARVPDAGSAA